MAVQGFNPFPDGFRLISGTKLNKLFRGNESVPAMAVTSLTIGSQLDKAVAAQKLAMTVTATANTDFTMTLPTGATVQTIRIYTTTAFGAVTDAQISIGNVATGNQYVAATSIKAAGVVTLSFAASVASASGLVSLPAGPNLFLRIAQSGGNSATGAASAVVVYTTP